MGIRFLCPNGHKLNVKNFLAGKRAICPKCGARVIVPAESEREPSPARTASGSEEFTADEEMLESLDESMLAEAREAALASMAVPENVAVEQPGAKASPAATVDPLSEAPEAVWYVRPATGGQYGPASGEIIRNWIRDGRIAGSSLVWRDGWPEWRSAAAIFPQLSGQVAAPQVASDGDVLTAKPIAPIAKPAEPAAEVSSSAMSPAADAAWRRKRRNDLSLIASGVLVVVSLILLVVLALVFRSQSASDEPADAVPPASAPAE